ncbi:MAG TPA: DUF2171 domain-containing protein [Myxococcaceae bacterium]|nr:DUF2171 domain-containing protein [Myxococcaceae bacterium]
MINPELVHEGMVVRCADGERLGSVIGIGETHFQVERGVLSPREYLVDFDHVAHVAGRHVMLDCRREDLEKVDFDAGGALPPRGATDYSIDTEPGRDIGY